MKLTKDIFDKIIERTNVVTTDVKVMFNWNSPSSLTPSEYNTAATNHQMLFNNYKDGLAHFLEEDQTKLLSSSLAGISVGLTNHALSTIGYGTFSGTDLISIPEKMCHEDWTVIINFEEEDCPSDPSKKRILLSSKEICSASSASIEGGTIAGEQPTTTTIAGTTTTAAVSTTTTAAATTTTTAAATTTTTAAATTTTTAAATTTTTAAATTTTTAAPLDVGFSIGINGAKNLFYEYYDTDGILKKYTMPYALAERNIIAVSKSETEQSINIYIFNAVDFTVQTASIRPEEHSLSQKWYLGGSSPIPLANETYQPFVGKIYEFLLFSNKLTKEQVIEFSKALLADDITNEGHQSVTETYYESTGFTENLVQTGTKITGYENQPYTVQDENNNTITLYELIPIVSPVFRKEVVYTQSSTPSTREIEQYLTASETYDYTYIKNYASTCILLSTTDTSSKDYQLLTSNKYTKNIGKKGTYSGSGFFFIEEDYDATKSVVIYINGLLQEIDADYTRDGININKYTGTYTQDDVLIYDVIDGGTQAFFYYDGNHFVEQIGAAGKDCYLDGKKLKRDTDYFDEGTDIELSESLPNGQIGVISKHGDTNQDLSGTLSVYNCSEHPLISEQLWIDGLRKLKNTDYFLTNPCDPTNSNFVVANNTTLIYENNESYFNI